MKNRENVSGMLVSLGVHGFIFLCMLFIKRAIVPDVGAPSLENVVAEEARPIEEVTQQLDTQQTISETTNTVAGGLVSTGIGGQGGTGFGGGVGGGMGGTGVGQKIEQGIGRDPTVRVSIGGGNGPNMDTIGVDLGAGEVTGEVGAVVEGYGAALDRMSQELMRMMRAEKITVVWMFDESESMKDDQQELKGRFQRVYEELKLVEKDAGIVGDVKDRKKVKERMADVLQTVITSFGHDYHVHTPKPTSDPAIIVPAIDKIQVDKTGDENTCAALDKVLKSYGGVARNGRKLVIILVSDESGDDWDHVEEVIHQAKLIKCPIYVMGRESVFGSLYAHVRWVQPVTGALHYLPIRRGPETPFAEQLQWDGFRRRRDAQMSGFGPYEQVRLARETGGIFFQLPNEETDINDLDNRKFDQLDLREYLPNIDARREYAMDRDRSPFRKAIWDVISLLNPYDERFKGMEIPDYEYFSINWAESQSSVVKRLQQITGMLGALGEAQKHLESVKGLRPRERSVRWRANYDLIYAQIFAYRVRLFEYAIALDQFGKTMPKRIKDKKSNAWSIRTGAPELIYPDADQAKGLKITKKDVEEAHEKAQQLLKDIIEQHPRTAWARRAEYEMQRNFGAYFNEHFFGPPTPPPPNQPTPPPPPKL